MPSAPARDPARSPGVAILLTWILPGSGHLYLGRPLAGLLGFLALEGLYALGLWLAGGITGGAMTFEFLEPELRGTYATALTPEIGNLGALIWQMRTSGYGPVPYEPRPWPEHIALGSLLCALSGIANTCLMAHAALIARRGARGLAGVAGERAVPPAAATWLAWLFPGLGHLVQGRRLRAAIVALVLVGLFAAGSVLAEGSNLSRERHFYYWGGQLLVGLPAVVGELVWGGARVDHEIPMADAGLLFGCLAGLLNVLAMLDVFAWGESGELGLDPSRPRGQRAENPAT